mgnify:CR=1
MNPFKQKEVSLTSGYYFDIEKKIIVYLDVDTQSEYFGNQDIYSRESNKKTGNSFELLLSGRNKSSNPSDLYSLEVLEDMSLNKSLVQDFDWICKDENVKESFVKFLNNNEFYNLLHLFQQYLNPARKEVKEVIKDVIEDSWSSYPKYIK